MAKEKNISDLDPNKVYKVTSKNEKYTYLLPGDKATILAQKGYKTEEYIAPKK